jgi:predicted protein tyrosine phosphatase
MTTMENVIAAITEQLSKVSREGDVARFDTTCLLADGTVVQVLVVEDEDGFRFGDGGTALVRTLLRLSGGPSDEGRLRAMRIVAAAAERKVSVLDDGRLELRVFRKEAPAFAPAAIVLIANAVAEAERLAMEIEREPLAPPRNAPSVVREVPTIDERGLFKALAIIRAANHPERASKGEIVEKTLAIIAALPEDDPEERFAAVLQTLLDACEGEKPTLRSLAALTKTDDDAFIVKFSEARAAHGDDPDIANGVARRSLAEIDRRSRFAIKDASFAATPFSRRDVEAGLIDADALISIGPSESAPTGVPVPNVPRFRFPAVLRLSFDDVALPEWTDAKGTRWIGPKDEDISKAMAFAGNILSEKPNAFIAVHCEKGLSRSAAVALAIEAMRRGPGKEDDAVQALLDDAGRRRFNPLIVRIADRILSETRDASGPIERALEKRSPAFRKWKEFWNGNGFPKN